ncbi:Flp pilus assembly protein TadG [Sphingomonas jinjuensis]|uniref:Flp pilus assembly protein TadG n=2 Tax=Sphingomonas jinjuensis TaxID=535907 RepID=A0A840FLQ9_9SPHN|nr:Flp pilus assembly protein TadG [Sphingomonas jinjuensis]
MLMMMGFAVIPLTFSTGMAIDYVRAARLQTKLNAVADAAALAAVTTPMMSKTSADACAQARLLFVNQTTGLDGLVINVLDSTQLAVSVTDNASTGSCSTTKSASSTAYNRTASITWTAQSTNSFSGVLGMRTITIGGKSETKAAVAPNIDFYVLLDTSGSMAFPATSAGITLLRSKTGGCAFACHSTNDGRAQDANGQWTDYYGVATSFGIPLRVDEARKAVQAMMSQATSLAQNNKAKYRAAMATFAASDSRANNSFKILSGLTNNLSSVSSAAAGAKTSLYYNNGCPKQDFCNNDTDTATSDAFTRANNVIPTPGNGTNASGDSPQGILFVITDGMRDEYRPNGRPEVAIDTALCTAIKNRGLRIAVLYTEFLQSSMDGNDWSQTNVVPYLYQIEPALQACASTGLYYKVTSDDDITAALNKLFQQAVATAHITQ